MYTLLQLQNWNFYKASEKNSLEKICIIRFTEEKIYVCFTEVIS